LVPFLFSPGWFVVEGFHSSALPTPAKAGVVPWVVSVPLAHSVCHEFAPGPWFVCDIIGVGFSDVGFYFFEGGQEFVPVKKISFDFEVCAVLLREVWAYVMIVLIFRVESRAVYYVVYRESAKFDP
jgi:hypothetical protein